MEADPSSHNDFFLPVFVHDHGHIIIQNLIYPHNTTLPQPFFFALKNLYAQIYPESSESRNIFTYRFGLLNNHHPEDIEIITSFRT
jgi:hypothetical protein